MHTSAVARDADQMPSGLCSGNFISNLTPWPRGHVACLAPNLQTLPNHIRAGSDKLEATHRTQHTAAETFTAHKQTVLEQMEHIVRLRLAHDDICRNRTDASHQNAEDRSCDDLGASMPGTHEALPSRVLMFAVHQDLMAHIM